MIGEIPDNFIKDLAEDLKQKDLKQIEKDFEIALHDCPENTNNDDVDFLSLIEYVCNF